MTEYVDLGIAGVGPAVLVGRGGSGTVYRARQDHLDRDVAVKIVPTGDDPSVIRRFEREQKAMGRLSQVSGIVPVHDAGITDHGDLYLIMPYMSGGSLQGWIQKHGPIRWETAVEIALHVAAALDGAHRHGIVHRDVKPGNVLLDAANRPLLADFGIALLSASHTATSSELTLTPAYSAPETFETNDGTTAGDVYSLGSTLWALIAGRAPFLEESGSTPLGVLVGRIVSQPIGDLRGVAPPSICDVIEAATAKDPADRPASAHEFAVHLRSARDGVPAVDATILSRVADPGAELPVGAPPSPPDLEEQASGRSRSARAMLLVSLAAAFAAGVGLWSLLTGGGAAEPEAGTVPAVVTPVAASEDPAAEEEPTGTIPEQGAAEPTEPPVATVEPTPSPPDEEATPLPTPVPATSIDAALDWLINDPDRRTAYGDTLGAEACADAGGTLSHCFHGPYGDVMVISTQDGTPEYGLRLAPAAGGWSVVDTFVEPDPPNPFGRPDWLRRVFGEPDLVDVLLRSRNFSDPTRAATSCLPTGRLTTGIVRVSEGKGLNVRSQPGSSDPADIILELGPGYVAEVLADQSITVGQTRWHMIRLPVPGYVPPRELAAWECGWVSGGFLDVDDNPVGYRLARCSGGLQLVVGGRTADGAWDVAVCADSRGELEYNGISTETEASIRLPACLTASGRYRAENAGTRYIVNEDGSAGASWLRVRLPNGDLAIDEPFGSIETGPGVGVNRC